MHTKSEVMLSTDLDSPDSIPYFLSDEPMTVAEFRDRLHTGSPAERTRLLAKLLREARDTDVWRFTSPSDVWQKCPAIALKLGRRRDFWEFLLGRWEKQGLLGKNQLSPLQEDFLLSSAVRTRFKNHQPVVHIHQGSCPAAS
jgi:hypothetical protein